MVAEPAQRLFTVEEFEEMIVAGIVREDEHIELIGGKVLCMAPMSVSHTGCVMRFDRTLKQRLPGTVDVRVQMPIRLPPDWEPEPDIAVVWHRDDDYTSAHPGPADVLLVVEVAASSLVYDRDRKLPGYAAAGIPEAWLTDLAGDRIWLYRSPKAGRYEQVFSVGRGDTLSPLAFPVLVFAVDDLLPPAAT